MIDRECFSAAGWACPFLIDICWKHWDHVLLLSVTHCNLVQVLFVCLLFMGKFWFLSLVTFNFCCSFSRSMLQASDVICLPCLSVVWAFLWQRVWGGVFQLTVINTWVRLKVTEDIFTLKWKRNSRRASDIESKYREVGRALFSCGMLMYYQWMNTKHIAVLTDLTRQVYISNLMCSDACSSVNLNVNRWTKMSLKAKVIILQFGVPLILL